MKVDMKDEEILEIQKGEGNQDRVIDNNQAFDFGTYPYHRPITVDEWLCHEDEKLFKSYARRKRMHHLKKHKKMTSLIALMTLIKLKKT